MKLILTSLIICLQLVSNAQNSNIEKGILIDGYDVVSYFNQSPQKGKAKISSEYKDAKLLFSSLKNKTLFDENPDRYFPQYGGWCAYAMGDKGKKVEIDPETYEIRDGKLYLFYHTIFSNTHDKWKENPTILRNKADANWKKLNQ